LILLFISGGISIKKSVDDSIKNALMTIAIHD